MKKRILAIVLCLMMAFTSVNIVFASNTTVIGKTFTVPMGSAMTAYTEPNGDSRTVYAFAMEYVLTIEAVETDANGVTWYKYDANDSVSFSFVDTHPYVKASDINSWIEVPEEPTPGEDVNDGTTFEATGLPNGAKLVSKTVPQERLEVAEDIVAKEVPSVATTESLRKTYNISVEKNGADWQPTENDKVKVTLDLGVDWINHKTYIQVIHVLDTVEAINNAENSYLHFGENLKQTYPEACAAAEAAGMPENTIVYTVMDDESGEVRHSGNGKITINATSFSDYTIVAYNVDNTEHMPEMQSEDGVKLNKTATVDPKTGTGTITLESYVKGTVESTATDVVLVIDHSGSMWTAVEPGNDSMLSFSELNREKATRVGYYVAFDKDENIGYRVKYANGKWLSDGAFDAQVYDSKGEFLGFINDIASGTTQIEFTSKNAGDYIFAVSISGALYDAMNTFMDEMKNAVNCRVAVVTFAGKVSGSDNDVWKKNGGSLPLEPEKDYKGSGIFINGNLTWDGPEPTLTNAKYLDAFEDPTSVAGQDVLYEAIDKISTNYGNTPTALGLLYARRLFIKSNTQEDRKNAQKVAIVFTDGIPSPAYLGTRASDSCNHKDKTSSTAAKECPYCTEVTTIVDGKKGKATRSTYIDQANKLKTQQKATVYSIGPTAGKAGVDVLRNIATSNDHYYNAGSADDIAEVFENIAGVIVSSSQELNKNTLVVDEISSSFDLPENVLDAIEGKSEAQIKSILKQYIKVYTEDYTGTNSAGEDQFNNRTPLTDANIELDGKTVKVSNFDYKENAVFMAGNTANGKKLVVEIPVHANKDFLGGDDVDTNEISSGVYNGTVKLADFPQPKVDVELKTIVPSDAEKDIYVSQQTSFPEVVKLGEYWVDVDGNGRDDGDEEWFSVDGINNAYVNIQYTVVDKANPNNKMTYTIPAGTDYNGLTNLEWEFYGDMTSTHQILTDDRDYEVTIKVISKNNSSNVTGDDICGTVDIDVFKPVITFKDSSIEWGETADYSENGGSVVWKHGNTTANTTAMGAAPELTYTYTYSEAERAFVADTPEKVTVTAEADTSKAIPANINITDYTTFYRDACDFEGCANSETTTVTGTNPNFVVHIEDVDLIIDKNYPANVDYSIDENQTFVFEVTGPNGYRENVVILGDGSAKIKDLPPGEYTVRELTDWSWRYQPDDIEKTSELTNENGVFKVAFTNTRYQPGYWLNGNAYCENVFGQFSGTNN